MAQGLVDEFVSQVIANSDYEEVDRVYLTNRVMAIVGEDGADAPATADANDIGPSSVWFLWTSSPRPQAW